MRRTRVKRGVLVGVATFAIAGGTASSQAASPPPVVFAADRAPLVSGEIYRADSNGQIVDLSRDTAAVDTSPVVSPDGKRVAFFSNRSGGEGVYEVGIDGGGIVQVAHDLQLLSTRPQLAWQPHGARLAFSTGSGIWIARPGGSPVRVRSASAFDGGIGFGSADQNQSWSPDGRVLTVFVDPSGKRAGREVAVSPLGHVLWTVRNVGFHYSAGWSAKGLLAITTGRSTAGARDAVAVYDEHGHLRFKVRFGRLGSDQPYLEAPWSAWSPDGSRLVLVSRRTFQVRTTTGRVVFQKTLTHYPGSSDSLTLEWDGNGRLVLFGYGSCGCHVRSVDIRTDKSSAASDRFIAPTSADNKLAVLNAPAGDEYALQIAPTAGGAPQSYGDVPACDDRGGGRRADAGSFQFVPGRSSIVYASNCATPMVGLYSVAAAGGPVQRIATSRANDSAPAVSPDGSEIVYSSNPCAGVCSATTGISVLKADGSGERALTNPPKCATDGSPAWSPDGATIVFGRTDCTSKSTFPELYTVPASGGAVHDLGIAGASPAWGPSRIAYVDFGPDSAPGVYVWTANPDGTDPVAVAAGDDPAWSPAGQLAYLKNNPRNFVVGSVLHRFPFYAVSSLAWSADGTRLVVTARVTATAPYDVYTVTPDGTDPVRLTTNYGAFTASSR